SRSRRAGARRRPAPEGPRRRFRQSEVVASSLTSPGRTFALAKGAEPAGHTAAGERIKRKCRRGGMKCQRVCFASLPGCKQSTATERRARAECPPPIAYLGAPAFPWPAIRTTVSYPSVAPLVIAPPAPLQRRDPKVPPTMSPAPDAPPLDLSRI